MAIGTVLFLVVLALAAALLVGALVTMFNPSIKNKAGPNWIWRLGKYDPVRGIFFKQDGSLRRHSVLFLSMLLSAALLFVLFILASLGWVIFTDGN